MRHANLVSDLQSRGLLDAQRKLTDAGHEYVAAILASNREHMRRVNTAERELLCSRGYASQVDRYSASDVSRRD